MSLFLQDIAGVFDGVVRQDHAKGPASPTKGCRSSPKGYEPRDLLEHQAIDDHQRHQREEPQHHLRLRQVSGATLGASTKF